jgi:hypothetical protein
MAISTESQELIRYYRQKVTVDQEQLNQLKIIADDGYEFKTGTEEELSEEVIEWREQTFGPDTPVGVFTTGLKIHSSREMLDLFDSLISPIDKDVIQINSQINALQNQILSLALDATAANCGSGFTSIIVYEDVLEYRGYSFEGSNPFEPIEGPIENGDQAGIGTYNLINQVAIGTYNSQINECTPGLEFPFFCDPQVCQNYANQIEVLNEQIEYLREIRDTDNINVNVLKEERLRYQMQDYAYRLSMTNLENDIAKSEYMISVLEGY